MSLMKGMQVRHKRLFATAMWGLYASNSGACRTSVVVLGKIARASMGASEVVPS